jgi:tRNA-dihydrouridine synthase
MLNSRKLPYEDLALTPETQRHPSETGLVPQILGNEEKYIKLSLTRLKDWGAVGVDINMGCPVAKALRHNYGVALMGDANYAAEVVKMTTQNTDMPVSVKLRAMPKEPGSQSDSPQRLLDFVGGLCEAGASWITLHPRTQEQQRRGHADWSQVELLKKHLKVPVLGNGDVQTASEALDRLQESKCDAVMVGRGLAARPWMLWQIGERLGWAAPSGRTGPAPRTALDEGQEYGRSLQLLLKSNSEFFSEALALRKFRFHVRITSVWLPFGQILYGAVCKAQTVPETEAALQKFFDQEIEMSEKTELRQ